jgi:6-phosphogluconolactonase
MLKYTVTPDADALGGAAAAMLAGSIRRLLENRRQVTLAVPGGRSAGSILRELGGQDLPWDRVHIFMADERLVPIESPDSNYPVVASSLIDPLQRRGELPAENAHPFVMDTCAADFGVAAYTEELDRVGGACDVVLLSAGEDGHVASLFPGGSVLASGPGYILVEDSPKPPPRRVSMSRALLLAARSCVLVFAGESKRAALDTFRDPEAAYEQCPAALVKGIPEAYVVTA